MLGLNEQSRAGLNGLTPLAPCGDRRFLTLAAVGHVCSCLRVLPLWQAKALDPVKETWMDHGHLENPVLLSACKRYKNGRYTRAVQERPPFFSVQASISASLAHTTIRIFYLFLSPTNQSAQHHSRLLNWISGFMTSTSVS